MDVWIHGRRSTPAVIAWVCLAIALAWRIGELTLPPHHEHAFRDSDGIGVARCFAREGIDLLEPRIMERGAKVGIVGMEFPIVNAAGAVLMKVGGIRDVLARLPVWLSLVPLFLGGWALGRRLFADEPAAAFAAACLVVQPLVVIYARKCMPEVPMLAVLVWAMALAHDSLYRPSLVRALWAALLFGLAAVLKPTGFAVAVPLAFWLRRALKLADRRREVWLSASVLGTVPLLIAYSWYAHAHALDARYGLSQFKLTHDWFEWVHLMGEGWYRGMVFGRVLHLYLLWPTVILMVLRWRDVVATARGYPDLVAWAAAGLFAVILFGDHLTAHPYYALPLLVPLTLFVGDFFSRASQSFRRADVAQLAFVAVFVVSAVVRVEQRASTPATDVHRNFDPDRLAAAMQHVPAGLTVATDGGSNVTSLVILDRLGWALSPKDLDAARLRTLHAEGARIVVETKFGGWLQADARAALPPPVWADDQMRAYVLPDAGTGSDGGGAAVARPPAAHQTSEVPVERALAHGKD